MQFCSRCLYPEIHPLRIDFDEDGICTGCLIHEEKDQIDWIERLQELRTLVEPYRNETGINYDCIIPVCGGKDSFFTVHIVKHILGLNPLLVAFNRHYNTSLGISNLERLRTRLGCDIMTETLAPDKFRALVGASLQELGSMHWPYLAGATVYPVQMAVRFKVPLIIWGAHQALDQVGMFSHHDRVEMTRRYRQEHDLMGYEPEMLIDTNPAFTEDHLQSFFYPTDKELSQVGVRGIYLNNFVRWDSKTQHELMTQYYGYVPSPQRRTFDTYNDIHDAHYSGTHDFIKFQKFGFAKATDHACRELRFGRLTREDALDLVAKYETIYPDDIEMFLEWLGWSEKELMSCIDRMRNKTVWTEVAKGDWQLVTSSNRVPTVGSIESSRLPQKGSTSFLNSGQSFLPENLPYRMLSRGFSDYLTEQEQKQLCQVWSPNAYQV